MRDWFDALEEREQMLVVTAVVVVVLAALWFGVWKPLDNGQESAAMRVDTWRLSLRELQPLKGRLQDSATPANQADQGQPLYVIVDSTLRQRGLYGSMQRSQPTPSGNGIRVDFENAAFDDLMLWLGDVYRQYGLLVQSASFSAASSDNAGRVNANVTLER